MKTLVTLAALSLTLVASASFAATPEVIDAIANACCAIGNACCEGFRACCN